MKEAFHVMRNSYNEDLHVRRRYVVSTCIIMRTSTYKETLHVKRRLMYTTISSVLYITIESKLSLYFGT